MDETMSYCAMQTQLSLDAQADLPAAAHGPASTRPMQQGCIDARQRAPADKTKQVVRHVKHMTVCILTPDALPCRDVHGCRLDASIRPPAPIENAACAP
jgi:hypothetical protein